MNDEYYASQAQNLAEDLRNEAKVHQKGAPFAPFIAEDGATREDYYFASRMFDELADVVSGCRTEDQLYCLRAILLDKLHRNGRDHNGVKRCQYSVPTSKTINAITSILVKGAMADGNVRLPPPD